MAQARRFLVSASGTGGNGHGYVTQPRRQLPPVADPPEVVERIAATTNLTDEPEAPSKAWVDAEAELAAERNRMRLLKRHEQAQHARQQITIENRMIDAERRAKLQHVSISHELHIMRKMLARGKEPTATARLEQVEALLDGVLNA